MNFETVIGLEVHVQLDTKSKVFATEDFAFDAEANHNVSPISMAHPGALPSINQTCIEYAIKLGLAMNCEIARYSYFDRKNYFYPDLPKGYQLSQDNHPICGGGFMDLNLDDGSTKRVTLHHIHLEEDAGKSIHDQDPKHTLIDLNRAGVGLLEVVTNPDFRSTEEVSLFLNEMRKLVRYLGISDGDMEKGNMRCDANISIRPVGQEAYGTRVEVKNLNSIRHIRQAIGYEEKRQRSQVMAGEQVLQQTRTFNTETGLTAPMRDKETADDYRYFPEPDLLPLLIEESTLERLRKELPELPWERLQRYTRDLGLDVKKAMPLTERIEHATYFEELMAAGLTARLASNWMLGPIQAYLNESKKDMEAFPVSPSSLAKMAMLVEDGKLPLKLAREKLLPALIEAPEQDPLALATSMNLLMESKGDELAEAMDALILKHPEEAKRFRNGKKQLAGFFIGQLMRQFKGKLDPKEIKQVVFEKLNG